MGNSRIYAHAVGKLTGVEYLNFINSIKSPQTQTQYAYCILHYMKFLKVDSPTDLLFNSDAKVIESHLRDYIIYLKGKVAYSTRNVNCSAIMTFYAMNDITLNKKKLYRYLGEHTRVYRDRAYTTEEISSLLQVSDLRLKSIVLFLASTGVRAGGLPSLKLNHLNPIPQYDIYRLTIYENALEEYYTFCTPECRKAIDDYLAYRQRSGERITPKSPLFREQFDLNDPFQIASPRHLADSSLQTMFDRALIRSGLRTVEHEIADERNTGRVRKDVARFNGFRKFFNTNLVRAKVTGAVKEMLMGHSLDLDDNYYKPTQQEVLEEYIKAVNYLTINDEYRLRMEVKDLKLKVDRFEEIQSQINDLRSKLREDDDDVDDQKK